MCRPPMPDIIMNVGLTIKNVLPMSMTVASQRLLLGTGSVISASGSPCFSTPIFGLLLDLEGHRKVSR